MVSRAIKFQTRSKYSHAAVMLDDGSVIEAWQGEGVRHIQSPTDGHKPGTPIDVFNIDAEYDTGLVEAFLINQLGKKYDYKSVFRFISRRDTALDDAWFCSELTVEAFRAGELHLLRGPSSIMSPRDVAISPYITFVKTIH